MDPSLPYVDLVFCTSDMSNPESYTVLETQYMAQCRRRLSTATAWTAYRFAYYDV